MTEKSKKVLLGAGLVGLGIYAYFSYNKYVKNAKKATKVKETNVDKEVIDDDDYDDEFDDDLDLDSERIDEIIKNITDIPDDDEEGSLNGRETKEAGKQDQETRECSEGEDIPDESEADEDAEDDDEEEEDIWGTGWDISDSDEEEGFYPAYFETACREMIDCAVAYKTKVIDMFDYGDDDDTDIYSAQLFHLFYVYVNQLLASYVTYGASELQRNLDRFKIIYRMFLYMLDSRGILELEKQYFDEIKEKSLIDPQKCRFSMGEAASIICDMAEEYIDLNDGIVDFEFALENFPYVKDEDIDKAEEEGEENVTVDAGDEEENDTEEVAPPELAPESENNSGPAPQKMRPKNNKKNRRSRR